MKTKTLYLILIAASLWANAIAQGTVLENYIQEGLKNNLQLQQEQLNYERSMENLTQARALFLPYISLNGSYQFADGGRKISIPIGDLVNPVYANLNKINAGINPDAPKYPVISNQSVNFLANNFHDSKVRIIQPLFNPEIYFNYKAQKELITVQQAQKKAYENQLKYEITSAYYQFLETGDAIRILQDTQKMLTELLKINQSLVANGKATRDAVLNAEFEIDKVVQQLAESEKNYQVSQAYFNFLINRDMNAPIERDTTLSLTNAEAEDISTLKTTALRQRHELQQLQHTLNATDQIVNLQQGNALLPKINVVGDVGYQGFYYTMQSDQQYWLVQFGLTWDIFKGGERRSRTQQARIDYRVTENKMEQLKKQIELQVIQAYYELESSKQVYAASVSGVKSSEKSFQIIRAKYYEGQVIMLEYLDAQNKVTRAQLTNNINHYELLRKTADLQRTISNL
jgi:outer membrane protein